MLPIDSEFSIIYLLYFIFYSYLIYKIFYQKSNNKLFLILLFLISLVLNFILYYNPENFEGGGSLVILFYSGIIFILSILTFIIQKLVSKVHK